MKGFFERVGMVGAIVLASAVIFAGIAGVVVVHRLDTAPAASSTQEQGSPSDEQGDGPSHKTTKPAKRPHPSPEPADSQDKGA